MVLDQLHVGLHKTLGKKYFPTSSYRAMIAHGFPILAFSDLGKLVDFHQESASANEVSSRPQGFNARSAFSPKREAGPLITQLLSHGPLRRREIARAIGRSGGFVDDAMRLLPQVKKVSTYYGLNEEEIYKRLFGTPAKGPIQKKLASDWLTTNLLEKIRDHGVYQTKTFAIDCGIKQQALTHLIHDLAERGLIRRVARGVWRLA